MMTNYVCVTFEVANVAQSEVLNFKLEEVGVESIEDRDSEIVAYFVQNEWPKAEATLKDYLISENITFKAEAVINENWNAKWEASFEPVNINNFCYVRAPFHPPFNNTNIIDIILEPKMAFGTAHHETTFMMMAQMALLDFMGKSVFDYGCGTAILSILAEKLGAAQIYAIDIEEAAIENAYYNAEINHCNKIVCEQKILSETVSKEYDIVLANINRHVLLATAADLANYVKKSGVLLVSGILLSDEDLVKEEFIRSGFIYEETIQKGEWKCLLFTK